MGVYHLMGLGLSPGVVTGPLSYLAYRYQRWNDDDRKFFSRSGEIKQREKGEKVGDIQAIVLFTTTEVIKGTVPCQTYIENQLMRTAKTPEQPRKPMREVLPHLIRKEWSKIRGEKSKERPEGSLFWVEVDRRDICEAYKRVVQVVAALAGVGGQGKEMWINLTGGNNVTNFALQLASTLSGDVSRLYYVQAEQDMEKCTRFTTERNYWIDLPAMPLALSNLNLTVLNLLETAPMAENNLYSRMKSQYWSLVEEISPTQFREISLAPMWKQGLLEYENELYFKGSQWELIQSYEQLLRQAKKNVEEKQLSLEKLAQEADWIVRERLSLSTS
ncbi:DUF6293 family protein [Kovacikia minuta CCNUW1]|uniref:DUF6293 family protein n=1 Tax=Kovacikia minuta TaxID=2931930 RepID=UPI001CC9F85C|nr:DUF6293 family protein [Kovacikia minuta]UBF28009.1 DUF6293 family protein [Kovacikia minuta CCNUW1]